MKDHKSIIIRATFHLPTICLSMFLTGGGRNPPDIGLTTVHGTLGKVWRDDFEIVISVGGG